MWKPSSSCFRSSWCSKAEKFLKKLQLSQLRYEEQIYFLWPLHLQGRREGTIIECDQVSQFYSSYNPETCDVHQSLL